MKNYYQVLGLNEEANLEEIKKSYKVYASKLHPDKHDGDKFFETFFKEIKQAYDILSNEQEKQSYDLKLKSKMPNEIKIRDKELILKNKEIELNIREKSLLKKLKDLELNKIELQKKQDDLDNLKEQLSLDKIKDNENYTHILLKDLKFGVKKVTVRKWLKSTGEYIKKDEIIVILETDKKEKIEVKSNTDGFLIYSVKVGKTLVLGNIIAIINK